MTSETNIRKKLLVVFSSTPYGSGQINDGLDLLLMAASYEQPVDCYFCGDGVFALIQGQQPNHSFRKNIGKKLSVLPLYDVENIHVSEASLSERQLNPADLCFPCTVISDSVASGLFQQADTIITF